MRIITCVAATLTAGLLAGCAGSGLTTGSLLSGSSASQVAAPTPPVATPTDRALQVAATSARAVKCGYYFDASKLKAAYIASEAQSGAAPDQMQRIEREFDAARGAVVNQIAKNPDYCSDERTREIKADLTRHLAGDYTPSRKVQASSGGGWLDGLTDSNTGREVMNPEWIKNPKWEDRTKRVE